jgi:hypothetical protein
MAPVHVIAIVAQAAIADRVRFLGGTGDAPRFRPLGVRADISTSDTLPECISVRGASAIPCASRTRSDPVTKIVTRCRRSRSATSKLRSTSECKSVRTLRCEMEAGTNLKG